MDNVELKAGHAPAAKIGGRRIPNRKDRKNSDSMEHSSSESSDDTVREFIDCDLPAKMEKSYPTVAVKKSHEKPIPHHQNVMKNDPRGNVPHVFQPRKQTH